MRLLFGAQTRAETDQQPGPVSAIVGEQLLLVGRPQRVAVADQRFEPRTEILRVTRRQRPRQFGTPALPAPQPLRRAIGGTGVFPGEQPLFLSTGRLDVRGEG